MGKKGMRPQKGHPETAWGELKAGKLSLGLTPTGKRLAKERAERLGISVSEVLELWGRGISIESGVESMDKPVRPTTADIMDVLPRLGRAQLVQIAWAVMKLLLGEPKTVEPELTTIAQLVRENQVRCLEMFADAVGEPALRVAEIMEGAEPTPVELSLLSAALPIDDEQLIKMLKKEFSNDVSNKDCFCDC